MTVSNVLFVMIITMVISSGIATIIIELFHKDENVIALFCYGITGNIIALLLYAMRRISNYFKSYILFISLYMPTIYSTLYFEGVKICQHL